MRRWTNHACGAIQQQLTKYGKLSEDTRSELWQAGLEALSTYPQVAGCCELDTYLQHQMAQRLELLRKQRNDTIALESPFSLDMPYLESRERQVDRIRGTVGDCADFVALWDYAQRLGLQKYRILHQMDWGLSHQEIMEANSLSEKEYSQILSQLQEDFTRWLSL